MCPCKFKKASHFIVATVECRDGTHQGHCCPARSSLRFFHMTIHVTLPDELVAKIDSISPDRDAFVVEAVRSRLRGSEQSSESEEIARINAVADELNREAEDVLEYQVIP